MGDDQATENKLGFWGCFSTGIPIFRVPDPPELTLLP